MGSSAVFFGSTTGNTERAAEKIASTLGIGEVINVAQARAADLAKYDALVLGTSTWDEGQLQEDWAAIVDDIGGLDLSGKTVALFGLGDQEGFGEWFVSAMGTLYRQVVQAGATVVGQTSTDGYRFSESEAVVDGKFVGLALDDDNEGELTDKRIEAWCNRIKAHFA